MEKHKDSRSTDELIEAILAEEDEDKARKLLYVLQDRATTCDILDKVGALLNSEHPKRRTLGADILYGLKFRHPEYPFRQEILEALLHRVPLEDDIDSLESLIYALGRMNDDRTTQALVSFSHHPEWIVRLAVAREIPHDAEAAPKVLIDLSSDEDEDVRNWATFGLAQMLDTDTPEIREALLNRLHDEYDEIRGEALLGLALRKDERVIEPLIQELANAHDAETLWDHIIEAASEMPDPRMCVYLKRLYEKFEISSNTEDYYKKAFEACFRALRLTIFGESQVLEVVHVGQDLSEGNTYSVIR